MWSGGTGGAGNNSQWTHNQWSFNASAYANVPADQVDWAALAQQWIQMKDSQQQQAAAQQFSDQLNHQMFMQAAQFTSVPTPAPAYRIDNALPQPDPWTTAIQEQHRHALPELPIKEDWPVSVSTDSFPAPDFNFQPQTTFTQDQPLPPAHPPPFHHPVRPADDYGEYAWNGSQLLAGAKKLPAQPKIEYNSHYQPPDITRSTQELDAIRRKSLPAWIREGLEKVEREKRKKQEKEEQDARKAQMLEEQKSKLLESQLENNTPSKWINPLGSSELVDEDKIDEDDKSDGLAPPPLALKDRLRAFLDDLNKEENFDQLMLCVRRQLTTILLDGTNGMMTTIAQGMLEKYERKAFQVKKSKAVASLKSELGGYGLTSYGGSDSDEESASDTGSGKSSDEDTEEEISREIERRKKNFHHIHSRPFGSEPKSPDSVDSHGKESLHGTTGDNCKVQEKESSTSSTSDREDNEGKKEVSVDKHAQENKREKVVKLKYRSLSSSSERSKSPSFPRDISKRSKKSGEKRNSKRSRSSSPERRKSRKSKSRSKSRERKSSKRIRSKSCERKRSKKSRSVSRDRRRSKRSRSSSEDANRSRKSISRSRSRERERRNSRRSSSSDRKSKKSRTSSRSRKRRSRKSLSSSRSPEQRSRKRSGSSSRIRSSRKSRSRSKSRDRKNSKRSRSRESKRSRKKSKSRSKSRERKSGKTNKSRDSKKAKSTRSRSKSVEKKSRHGK